MRTIGNPTVLLGAVLGSVLCSPEAVLAEEPEAQAPQETPVARRVKVYGIFAAPIDGTYTGTQTPLATIHATNREKALNHFRRSLIKGEVTLDKKQLPKDHKLVAKHLYAVE